MGRVARSGVELLPRPHRSSRVPALDGHRMLLDKCVTSPFAMPLCIGRVCRHIPSLSFEVPNTLVIVHRPSLSAHLHTYAYAHTYAQTYTHVCIAVPSRVPESAASARFHML